jgi:glycosyltransferase involved in cell wall biosynthesis
MKLRILHVLASSHLGGAEQMCLWLASNQATSGNDVAVWIPEDGRVAQAAQLAGIATIRSSKKTREERLPRRKHWELLAVGLWDAVEEFRPNLVHSHVPLANLMCHRVVRKRSVPWVATVHGSWRQFAYAPQTQSKPYLKPYLLLRHALGDLLSTRSAARIVAISDYVRKELKLVGISPSRIVRIHDGLPESHVELTPEIARERQGISRDALVIGSLGFMAPVKGFDLLVRAAALLLPSYPQLLLLIAGGDVLGDNSVRFSLNKLVMQLKLQRCVRLLDTVEPNEGFLSTLDIFVVSSRTEGLSLSLLAAMRHGKPSVMTSAGGCSEAARPGLEGLVFDSGNVRSLAQTIAQLLRDNQLRNSMGQSAAERARGYLTLSRCADEYSQLYDDVLSSKSQR